MRILLLWCLLANTLIEVISLHLYAAAVSDYFIFNRTQLQQMYKCKDKCLSLQSMIDHPLKYHRIVYAKTNSPDRYMEGHCLYSASQPENWIQIANLQKPSTQIHKFVQQCENKTLQIDKKHLQGMGLSVIHSEYQFYSNGTFVNLQKEVNINDLLKNFKDKMNSEG